MCNNINIFIESVKAMMKPPNITNHVDVDDNSKEQNNNSNIANDDNTTRDCQVTDNYR